MRESSKRIDAFNARDVIVPTTSPVPSWISDAQYIDMKNNGVVSGGIMQRI